MATDKKKSTPDSGLRRRAEDQLIGAAPQAGRSGKGDETQRLLHELQVHQLELEMQNAELQQGRDDLDARAAELANANIELEAFNYTVSHDLRRPLSVIAGYCQVLRDLCRNQLDEESMQYIHEMYRGSLQMNRLIDTLLEFSSVKRVVMNRKNVNLSRIAEDVVMALKAVQPECRATVRIASDITASGDADLLWVLLDNLLGNAWKYAGSQEGALIEFGVVVSEGNPVYFVRDNGPGFDMATVDKIFIPFQRLPGSDIEGHGIGLATVDRIVKRHDGRVWADSGIGKGATFFFTLE